MASEFKKDLMSHREQEVSAKLCSLLVLARSPEELPMIGLGLK